MSDGKQTIGWAIIEQMGHKKLAGYVTETELAGAGFLRVDIYATIPARDLTDDPETAVATQYVAPSSLYALTPTTESLCRQLGERLRPQPVTRWELPAPAKPEPITDAIWEDGPDESVDDLDDDRPF